MTAIDWCFVGLLGSLAVIAIARWLGISVDVEIE